MLAACGGGGGGSDVETVVNPGQPPTANAGAAATYNGGEIAMLDGTGSSDPDGDPLRYAWTQTAGTKVQLADAHAARPVFEVPRAGGALTFSLTVNDGWGDSAPATVTVTASAYAGAKVDPPGKNPFRGSYDFSGAGQDFVIAGDQVYLPAGANRLRIVDVADPASPVQVAAQSYPDKGAHDATLIGSFLFHTDYDSLSDVHVYATNVSNPASPSLAGQVAMSASPGIARLTSANGVLYLASWDDATHPSLRVYEVTDTANPVGNTTFEISQPLPSPPEDVEVAGSHAYVADGVSGLRIIDVGAATAATPAIHEAGSYDTAGKAANVAVAGSTAYVADTMNGLVILDVSNPAAPSLVATIPVTAGSTYGVLSVDVAGSRLYFSDDFDVRIYDVSTPASPAAIGRYRAGNLIRKVRASGSYLYVTDSMGLRTIPVAKVSPPRGAPLYTAPATVREMKAYGDLGFVRMDGRVDILDLRNAAAPSVLSSYTAGGFDQISGMAIVGNFAYLTQGTGSLKLLRFRDPAAAAVARTIAVGAGPQTIVATDAHAYVYRNAFPNADVVVYDVANPYSPVARGSLASPHGDANWLRSMAVKDGRLYLTELNTQGTFRVANVSDPAAPALIGGLGPVDLYGIAFRGDHVLAVGNNGGLNVLDVSTPASPVVVGAGYAKAAGYSISVAGSRAYVNSDFVGGGVKVVDVEDPLAPGLAGELAPAGGADLPVVVGPSLYTLHDGKELHRNEREPMLASRFVSAGTGATIGYTVSWQDEAGGDDHQVRCEVTGGSCTVGAIQQAADSAAVSWTVPGTPGDHEIMIVVGNGHYFGTTRDRVKVQ
jgi:hypothetical protein